MSQVRVKTVPERSAIPEAFTWELETVYPSPEAWEAELAAAKAQAKELAACRGTLASSAGALLRALKLNDEVSEKIERVFAYARMRRDQDNTDASAQALCDRAMAAYVEVRTASSWLVPEILALPEARVAQYLEEEPELGVYRHFLDDIQRGRPHVRSAEVEEVLALSGEMASGPDQVYSMLTDADMEFGTVVDERGEEVQLSHGRFLRLMEARDRRVRQAAFETFYRSYEKQHNTLAALLAASVKKDIFYARARRYASCLEAALHPDNVPPEVYTGLIATVRRNLGTLQRYLRLRRQALGVEELHMYDLYVPLVPPPEEEIPFARATELVLDGLSPLGEGYLAILREAFGSRWIDVYETRGKSSGAYAWGIYRKHPFVLLNYHGTLNDVFTLAHEMGHAVHRYLTEQTQPFVYADQPIFVAEVASTVNEVLLTQHFLATLEDRALLLSFLNHFLDEFRTTLFRQTMFAEFELRIHEEAERGGALTPEFLNRTYRELNLAYHGEEAVVDRQIDYEWSRVPHFYRAFYVYKYATGFSAAVALARRILQEGEDARERYLAFLRSGSSDYALNLLQQAGVDLTTPEPVQQALDVMEEVLDRLEALL